MRTMTNDGSRRLVTVWPILLLATVCCGVAASAPGGGGDHGNRAGAGAGAGTGAGAGAGAGDGADGGEGAGAATGGLVLRGGWIVNPRTQTVTQGDLYMCGGVVVSEADGRRCAPTEVDATGKWLIPGLVDTHVHARGVSGGDGSFVDMTIDAEAALFRVAGVTGVLDAMNDEAKIFPMRDAQRSAGASLAGADVFATGGAFTPTGGHGTEYGLPSTSFHIVDSAADVEVALDALAAKRPDMIKIFYDHRGMDGGPDVADGQEGALGVAMKKEVMVALVAGAAARHLTSYVHIGVWNDARDAILAGATAIAHLGEPIVPDDIVAAAHDRGVFWIPTMSLYHGLDDVIADPTLLDDPLLAKVSTQAIRDSYRAGARNVDRYTVEWLARHTNDAANVAKLARGGVKLLAGTDAVELGTFIGWSLHRELVLLAGAGLSPWDALAAATTRAGELLGHDFGIDPGSEANVVVLGASPIDDIRSTTKTAMVVHHGRVVVP